MNHHGRRKHLRQYGVSEAVGKSSGCSGNVYALWLPTEYAIHSP
jgi:hypothetical protein